MKKTATIIVLCVVLLLGGIAGVLLAQRIGTKEGNTGSLGAASGQGPASQMEEPNEEKVPSATELVWAAEPYLEAETLALLENYATIWRGQNLTWANSLNMLLNPQQVDATRLGSVVQFYHNGRWGIVDFDGNQLVCEEEDVYRPFYWFLIETEGFLSGGTLEEKVFADVRQGGSFTWVPVMYSYMPEGEDLIMPVYSWLKDGLVAGGEVTMRYFDDGLVDGFIWDKPDGGLYHYSDSIHNGPFKQQAVPGGGPYPAWEMEFAEGDENYPTWSGQGGYVQDNEVILPFQYDYVGHVNNGVALVLQDGTHKYIDMQGDSITDVAYGPANGYRLDFEYAQVLKRDYNPYNSQEDFMQLEGYYNDFTEGLCAVNRDGLYGYINTNGQEVIAPQFEAALPQYGGRAWVKQNGLWGVLDVEATLA